MNTPYRALRAFVEIVASGGVASAARTLSVTPSAVSHLIADLEARIGTPLFADRRRGLLSETGARLAERLRPAFETIDTTMEETGRRRTEIRISTLSSFAVLWLIPRLPRLQTILPGINLLVSTDTRTVDLNAEPFDCVVRWGAGGWTGLDETLLFREELCLLASPRLVREKPGAVWTLPRLEARSRPNDWSLFLPAELRARHSAHRVSVFETRALMLQAAIAGLGAAVIDVQLASDALAAGLLVPILPDKIETNDAYFFCTRKATAPDRRLVRFRDWLVAEAQAAPVTQ